MFSPSGTSDSFIVMETIWSLEISYSAIQSLRFLALKLEFPCWKDLNAISVIYNYNKSLFLFWLFAFFFLLDSVAKLRNFVENLPALGFIVDIDKVMFDSFFVLLHKFFYFEKFEQGFISENALSRRLGIKHQH